ncbi:MAG: septum formation initiator family protein [Clostridia bacterium]|nr:septum formation initiator family protein [Clostridia bacterium]
MEKERKKQFSLTLLTRVLLGVLVVVSIGIFANSVMRYNVLLEEQRELEEQLEAYREMKEELQELLDSGEDYDVIVRIAKEKWGLQFPDEEIFYKD